MSKHVIVIASGETERRALPHLVRHLSERGVLAGDVRIPPRNMALDVAMAESLIKAAWYENLDAPPDNTARVAAEIAGMLDATMIVQRSPSFRTFVDAVMNGPGGAVPSPPTGDNP